MKKKLLPVLIVTVIVVALGFARVLNRGVSSLEAKRGTVVEAVYGLGTVTSNKTFHLKTAITTVLRTLAVQEGQAVKKGDLLVKFDESAVQKAPFDGVITAVNFKEGEAVFPQVTVLSLSDLSDLYLVVSLEQQGALRVRPGHKAQLSFESIRGERIIGVVKSIYPNEGQFLVRIDVENLPKGVLPGMTADIAIEVARKDNALLIPLSSVNSGFAMRERAGSREKIPVKIGNIDGEWAEVLSGDIKEGDELIISKAKK